MVELHDARSLASAVAACSELRDVRLFQVEAALDNLPSLAGHLTYSFDANIEVQYVPDTSSLIVDGTYKVTVTVVDPSDDDVDEQDAPEGEEDDHDHLAHLNFQLAALYAVVSEDERPKFLDRELDAFGQTTGLLALHPYAREFVSTMTGRMGLPPLHLPTAHIPLDKRNDDHADLPDDPA